MHESMIKSLMALTAAVSYAVAAGASLPQVDLGYEIHQAISFNATGQLYTFQNIRYAQPPVGKLRFAAPVAPTGRNENVQNGSIPAICPQASPNWTIMSTLFATATAEGNAENFNYTAANIQAQLYLQTLGNLSTQPPVGESEDCLFLDVVVPKAVFDGAQRRYHRRNTGGAPVLVWIYGGGYYSGVKGGENPSGLIRASQAGGSPGVVYVALNYRLGALGWLAGPSLQAAGGVSNAGLYDQRLALEWINENIHLFGGDPNQVTIMGQSAGGGSILHQITAYGGNRPVRFQRAILQSPGWLPTASQFVQENTTQAFLKQLNVSTIEEAQMASSEAVQAASFQMITNSPYGRTPWGPVVDGSFVPSFPSLLLNAGFFAKNVTVMAGHNTNEAPVFTPPFVKDDKSVAAFISEATPGAQQEAVDYVIKTLYPAVYDGTYPYTSPIYRTFLIWSESIFTCNTHYLAKAYGNKTYNYQFEVFPAFHASDVPYTFYNGQGTNLSQFLVAPTAEALQGYITNFAKTGNPNGPGLPVFPMQNSNATEQGLNATYVQTQRDPTSNYRCDWWQKALLS